MKIKKSNMSYNVLLCAVPKTVFRVAMFLSSRSTTFADLRAALSFTKERRFSNGNERSRE
jgi:hypothetical protein